MANPSTMASTLEPASDNGQNTAPVTAFKKAIMFYTDMYTAGHIYVMLPRSHLDYFFQWKMWRLSQPQLLLRRGGSKDSPIVNYAKYRPFSRTMQLGQGDPENQSENGPWTELRREKNFIFRSDYRFSTGVGDRTGKITEFCWRKNKRKHCRTVYDCVNQEAQVVAKLFSGGMVNVAKGAEIELLSSLEQELEEFLLMSALAVWAMESMEMRSILPGYSSKGRC